jgi:hypothetical protein
MNFFRDAARILQIRNYLPLNLWQVLLPHFSPRFFKVLPFHVWLEELSHIVNERKELPYSPQKIANPAHILMQYTEKKEQAHEILTFFFWQIMHTEYVQLNFSLESLSKDIADLKLSERMLYHWSDDFVTAMRQIYCGFYQDDQQQYDTGLRALHLEAVAEELRQLFGEDPKNEQYFHLKDYAKRFEMFLNACVRAQIQLHPNFIAFGLAFCLLTQTLESFSVAICPSRCFADAFKQPDRYQVLAN